jgi:hypothetical protein
MKIITFACDCYADIAPAWEFLLNDRWPDHPEVVYVTNSVPLEVDGVAHYMKGTDIELGRRIRKLPYLYEDDELILVMMIDYLIQAINTELIEESRQLCETKEIAHVRLRPMPHPSHPAPDGISNERFGLIDKSKPYALSLQPGIWRPNDLAKCVRDKWSPWHCETMGSKHTKRIPGYFLSTRQPAIVHLNYYRRRKEFGVDWVRENVPEEFWPNAARRG